MPALASRHSQFSNTHTARTGEAEQTRTGGPWWKHRGLAFAVVGVLVLALLPYAGLNDSTILTVSTIFMWIILASSWNIISGFAGYIDFGHAVYFGIGGYVAGILVVKSSVPFALTVFAAAIVSAVFALIIGYPLLRLRGVYFSIAMLGAFLAVRELVSIAAPLTGGAQGLVLPPIVNRLFFYYVFFVGAVCVVALVWGLRRSQLGSSLLAIKDDERGAEARGINTTLLKLGVFTASAAITGSVGALFAYQVTFIDPGIMFRDSFLITVAIMATLGGLGTVWGPAIGAALFLVVRDALWSNEGDSFLIVFGAVLILLVLFMPEGIIGTFQRGDRTQLGRRIKRVRTRFQRTPESSYTTTERRTPRSVVSD